jgi:hypothetical protein
MVRRVLALLIATTFSLASADSQPAKPDEKQARGDQILREMSNAVAGVKILSFTAEEFSEKVGKGGQKSQAHVMRDVVVRRPNGFRSLVEGDRGVNAWYDGKELTLVSDAKKVWATGEVPPTLDETMDYVADVYDLKLPWADLLYSSPYEALTSTDTAGGWVDVETIDGKECDRLSYQQPVVDWQLWVTRAERYPKQLQITYKQDPGAPVMRVVFKRMALSSPVDDDTFQAKVPDGYTQIPLVRRDADLDPEEASKAAPSPAAPAPPAAPEQ